MKNRSGIIYGLAGGVMIAVSAGLVAGTVNIPHTFTAGTQAKASDVNANFTAVKVAVDDNDTRIAALKTTAEADTARISSLRAAVDVDAARILALETRVPNDGNLTLPNSTESTGNILKDSIPFLHNYGTDNVFAGVGAGNLSMRGERNSAFGRSALRSNTTGFGNTAVGRVALTNNTTGERNTAIGLDAMASNTTGIYGTAVGAYALSSNSTGDGNSAFGEEALAFNTTGDYNTAAGYGALFTNTTGIENTSIGTLSLYSNLIGGRNTAIGSFALRANTAGFDNAAFGAHTLEASTTGSQNTVGGTNALNANTNGNRNTALGGSALQANTTGANNVAIGFGALLTNISGLNNIALGTMAGNALTTGSNNIHIGNTGLAGETAVLKIGSLQSSAYIAGIRGVTTGSSGVPVLIDALGQLGTAASSRKVKDHIENMAASSDALMKLRPVTFYYKLDKNKQRALQYGLIAEEVAKVAPELVARDAKGEIETVYYQFLAPMLLNEFQKQQRVIESQAREIVELKKQNDRIEAWLTRIEAQESPRHAGR